MIIVSQSKSKIINLNNIEMLYLTRVNNKYGNVQSVEVNARGSYDCNLGEYKKEERAKEVLNEIILGTTIKQIAGKQLTENEFNMTMKCMEFNLYEMPLE